MCSAALLYLGGVYVFSVPAAVCSWLSVCVAYGLLVLTTGPVRVCVLLCMQAACALQPCTDDRLCGVFMSVALGRGVSCAVCSTFVVLPALVYVCYLVGASVGANWL
jgi:hypothetical protein